MTPEAQRIAIAEACGWKFPKNLPNCRKLFMGFYKDREECCVVPNYLSDLNAMHEAEVTLENDPANDAKYWETLYQVLDNDDEGQPIDGPPNGHWCDLKKVGHATAAQRAEAFLRVLNLWNDSK